MKLYAYLIIIIIIIIPNIIIIWGKSLGLRGGWMDDRTFSTEKGSEPKAKPKDAKNPAGREEA